MRIAYFDCFSGISGDMTLAALLACGADANVFREELAKLGVPGYRLHLQERKVGGLMATDVDVELLESDRGHGRHLPDIQAIYRDSGLSPGVRDRSLAIFTRLAEAEAKVHGATPDQIHFHEVGAVDALVDITGTCILLEMLGVEAVYCSPLPLSRGFVDCQHGRMPLPAPATAELLLGLPTYPVSVLGELVTPTGAAIIATLSEGRVGDPPPMTPTAVGYGAGKKDFGAPLPNLLRVLVAEAPEGSPEREWVGARPPTKVTVLETNLDDTTGEALGYVQERLLAAGALDVFFVPVQMKKNRPGTLLTVLVSPENAEVLAEVIFAETGTFGVRRTSAERYCLDRTWETVETSFGAVRVKVGKRSGREITAAPEFEDCRRAAKEHGVALQEVYHAALLARYRK